MTDQLLKENLLMKEVLRGPVPDQGHIAPKCNMFARLPDPWGLFSFIYSCKLLGLICFPWPKPVHINSQR